MTQDDRNWAVRAKYVSALGTIYSVSLSFFVVLSMMFATLVGQLQKPILIEAATCSLPASISTTIELTPESADNIIDCSGQDITITGTGKLVMKSYSTADSSSANDGGVLLKVANLTIQAGGEISADGQGYVAGAVDGGSATASTGIAAGSGGGHGGAGGSGNTIGGTGNEVGATGGLIGNKDYPITIGGAGGTSGGAGVGGAGGGAIKIESSGTVTIDGKITADGQAGVKSADNQTAGGGGAGGSIWVQAQVLAGSGTVSAKGGGTDDSATYYGGGGGGGRVALICTTSTTFPAGNVSVTFGIGSQNGQVGSLVGPGCKPAEPAILKLYEKNATAGYVDRELSVSDLTTKTAFTFASDLAGANLKLEVEVREKNVSFQNTITNSQVSVLSNKTCLNVPGGISPGSGAVGGGSPGRSGKNGTGGGGAGGQNGGSKAVGGDGGSGVVIVRYVTTDAPATVTGGTVTTSGIYTIHTFTNRGTFATSGNVTVEYLIVGGGGGGGAGWQGGGGGAGGVLSGSVALSAQSYPIIVGAGGQGDRNTSANSNGGNSSFNELVAIGGGRGASENPGGGGAHVASVGGSGGGGSHGSTPLTGAAGTAGQGNSGGSGYTGNPYVGGGGGGAGGAGQNSTSTVVGIGGVGVASSISGSTKYYGAGGGGSRRNSAMAPLISTYCGYVEVATGFSAGKEYKWQARVISSAGIPSGWVQFGDNSISSTDFTVVGVPATMEITEGNNQSVQVGEVVPIRPKVRILDATGFGVPFYTLTGWSVLSGGGLLTHTMVKTDELGYVTTEWTVGTVSGVGNNSIRIANTTPALSATFVASALPGAIASYGVNSENSLSLVNNPFSYTITAKDEYGNIVPFTNNLTVVPVSSHNIANPGLGVLTPYTISFAQAPSEIPWLNASWGYRKKVSFDNTTVNLGVTSVALTDFPVLIQLTSANFDFTKAKANGEDIRMVDADGVTLLPYEIEKWDSAAQTAYIWTRVPKIDADSAVDGMYVYYGNAAASDSQSARNTWESNFKMVLHTSESTGTILNDSTSNNNDGTKLSETEPNAATGVIVGGQSFDGVNDKVTVAHSAALNILQLSRLNLGFIRQRLLKRIRLSVKAQVVLVSTICTRMRICFVLPLMMSDIMLGAIPFLLLILGTMWWAPTMVRTGKSMSMVLCKTL